MADNGVQRPPFLDPTAQAILNALKDVSFRPLVIDNLTSSDTGSPLSANQGKVLKGLVDANTSAINAITTTSTWDTSASQVTGGSVYARKRNGIVTISANVYWVNIFTGDYVYDLCVLPSEYRPSSNIVSIATLNDGASKLYTPCNVTVKANGTISLRTSAISPATADMYCNILVSFVA